MCLLLSFSGRDRGVLTYILLLNLHFMVQYILLFQYTIEVEADEHIFKFLKNKFSAEETRYTSVMIVISL